MSSADLLHTRVAILGLGLMGGSLAMALRGRCQTLFGADPDPTTVRMASQRRIVDRATQDPAEILPQSDLVVLAAPVSAILDLILQLPDLHPGQAVVLDLGSTKAEITRALATLPERFDPLGGHPMCGKDKLSLTNADPDLFRGAVFTFTPLPRTTLRGRALAEQLARIIGAHPMWLDPQTHDRWTAATSHVPYLVAAALAGATPAEAAPLVGPGFRSTTRLAATPTSVTLGMLATNRAEILAFLGHFRQWLDALEGALNSQDWVVLKEFLDEAARRQAGFRNSSQLRNFQS